VEAAVIDQNKQVVRRYFASVASGDGKALDWLADDVAWWVPQGSSLGGTYHGKPAVMELMARGVGAYAPDVAMEVEIRQLVAEGDRVCAEVELRAAAADGTPYCNRYHFAFRLRDGRIVEVSEYVDTRYVHDTLGL
jgi:ketosteroid isomerase-like protein